MSIHMSMQMPKNCKECPIYWEQCGVDPDAVEEGYRTDRERHPDCPLVPVPEHGRQDGLYSKYFVINTETGEIVQDCFVLRPQKDKAAVAALLLYANETESQELSSDIRGWLSTIIPSDKEGEE